MKKRSDFDNEIMHTGNDVICLNLVEKNVGTPAILGRTLHSVLFSCDVEGFNDDFLQNIDFSVDVPILTFVVNSRTFSSKRFLQYRLEQP
jgi:hypothetical protein